MTPRVGFRKWYEDETYDSVFIDFTGVSGGFCGYEDIPESIKTGIFTAQVNFDGDGPYNYAEVINPEPFLNSDFSDTYELNGYNIKKLILDAYNELESA